MKNYELLNKPDNVPVVHVRLHLASNLPLAPRGRHEKLHQLEQRTIPVNLEIKVDQGRS